MGEKKGGIVRKLMFGVVGLFGLFACGIAGMHFVSAGKLAETVEVEVADISVPDGDRSAMERGKYLVNHLMGCRECHGDDLGGKVIMDNGAMGLWYGPNLTRGKGSKLADYSSKDWMRALRHGVGKDGRRLLLMPSEDYVNFGDDDMAAVVAYFRSLPPVDREDQGISLGPIGKMLVATGQIPFAFEKIDPKARRPEAKPGPTREWGAVLIGSCTGCHGTGLSGGKIPGGDPKWPQAANISPDKETGLGQWSYEDFVKAMREGKRKDGSAINEAMPWKAYAGMKDDDLRALWEYIKAAPAKAMGGR
ncbi:cytochrome C [bacterium]|nr:MAG: cytochrome C [bacterium]RIK60728.1 MAG: cytochrome C [Planctomycetota bacterium]